MHPRSYSRAYQVQVRAAYRFRQSTVGSNLGDPFAVDPVRRSAIAVTICLAIVVSPMLSGHELGVTIMLTVGWLAAIGLVFCVPILVWSVVEAGFAAIRRRLHPPIESLNLPPRILHILHRHQFDTIVSIERADDTTLLLLANIDQRDVAQIRRSITLWRYARWQAAGFPTSDAP